jgi:hypothetical protein
MRRYAQSARMQRATRVVIGSAGTALICGLACSTVAAGAVSRSSVSSRPAPGSHDWPAYLDGPLHMSYSRSQTVITAATAKDLVPDRSRL